MFNMLNIFWLKQIKRKVGYTKNDILNIAIAEKCISNIELAKLTGLGEATITRIKKGVQKPTLKTIGLLAKALEVSVTDLIVIDEK